MKPLKKVVGMSGIAPPAGTTSLAAVFQAGSELRKLPVCSNSISNTAHPDQDAE